MRRLSRSLKAPFWTIPALSFVMAVERMFAEATSQDLHLLEAFGWVKCHQC